MKKTMKVAAFVGVGQIALDEKPIPIAQAGDVVMRVTLTTICGTDLHILRGEYPIEPGLTVGHEAVGVIAEIGAGVRGYSVGQRVLVGAITPCGQCAACLSSNGAQCGDGAGYQLTGGWRFGHTIDGAQAEYLRVPNAQANLALIPDSVSDTQALMLADVASTGFAGAESGGVRLGDAVVVLGQGPIGLCAVVGARLMGAALIIGVDPESYRRELSRRMGANVTLNPQSQDVVAEVKRLTGGGADVAIEALGSQATFEQGLRCLRPAGTLSSLGVYATKLQLPNDAFSAGIGGQRIVTSLCPGGKERMRRLLALVEHGRLDLQPLVTHTMALDQVVDAYRLFGERREGVLKIALKP